MGVSQSNVKPASSTISQVKPSDNTYRPVATGPTAVNSIRHVCIGINYPKSGNALTECINDAHNMETFITSRGSQVGIFLSDDEDPSSFLYPCKENIIRALKWGTSSASVEEYLSPDVTEFPEMISGTLCFFTYSGHGSHVRDQSGDDSDGYDEVICPVARDGTFDDYLVDDTIGDVLFHRSKADCNVLIITDCCNSGTNSDLRFTVKGRGFTENRRNPIFKGPVIHISGCQDTQYSYEGTGGGYLTLSFIEAMKTSSKSSLLTVISRIRTNIASRIGKQYQLPELSVGHKTSVYSQFPL